MRRALLAIALMAYTGSAQAAPCYNAAFNISRASECLSYTTDRQKQNDLKDKRLDAINEWVQHNPLGGATLELMLREGDRRMNSALARDLSVFSDDTMWKSRGCAELPVCVVPQSAFPPRARPVPRVLPRNTRTGGTWCGPRDRASGYCNWKGWAR